MTSKVWRTTDFLLPVAVPAGETKLSKDEIIDWCKDWAEDRVYALVGQNCWSMVHDFLTTHEGCEIPESVR
jgi:hypothetical protein